MLVKQLQNHSLHIHTLFMFLTLIQSINSKNIVLGNSNLENSKTESCFNKCFVVEMQWWNVTKYN